MNVVCFQFVFIAKIVDSAFVRYPLRSEYIRLENTVYKTCFPEYSNKLHHSDVIIEFMDSWNENDKNIQ